MLAMGRALMMDPSVLLLDEPSAGLSPANQDMIFDRIRQIADTGVSIVMVEQNARRCLQICDRGYVLDQGRNAYTGAGSDDLHLTVRGRRVELDDASGCERATEQFRIDDTRSAAEVAAMLQARQLDPVWKDWDEAILGPAAGCPPEPQPA